MSPRIRRHYRLLDRARHLLDGKPIDWEREQIGYWPWWLGGRDPPAIDNITRIGPSASRVASLQSA